MDAVEPLDGGTADGKEGLASQVLAAALKVRRACHYQVAQMHEIYHPSPGRHMACVTYAFWFVDNSGLCSV